MSLCKKDGCTGEVYIKGFCRSHYEKDLKFRNKNKPTKPCKIKGCNSRHYCKGYCQKHYQHMYKWGEIKKTEYDDNEIINRGDYSIVKLYNDVDVFIDSEDVEKVKVYKWSYCNGYAYCHVEKVYMHRLLINCTGESVVDHINGDPLDNRKNNLRVCTHAQNLWNTGKTKGYRYRKDKQKWIATIMKNREYISLGYFDTEQEAKRARQIAEIEYFGEYAPNQEVLEGFNYGK